MIKTTGKLLPSAILIPLVLYLYLFVALVAYLPYLIYINKILDGDVSGNWWALSTPIKFGAVLQKMAIPIAFLAIIWGIRKMRKSGKSLRHAFTAVAGLSICISFIAVNFYVNHQMSLIYKGFFETNIIARLEEKLRRTDLTSKQKAFIEKQMAREVYWEQNRLIDVAAENGNRSKFTPSDADKALMQSRNILKGAILSDKKAAINCIFIFAFVLLIGILMGILLSIRKVPEHINER